MKKILLYSLFFLLSFTTLGQNTELEKIEAQLELISQEKPGLLEKMRIDISGLTLYDLIGAIAQEHELNVSVDDDLNQVVRSNFYDVLVSDVFLFLTQKYELEMGFVNGIITFEQKQPEPVVEVKKEIPPIDVTYNANNNFLSVKLKNDSLPRVAQRITELSGKNIVLSPEVKTFKVSAYIVNRPFDQVIEMMAKSNQLIATQDDNGFYFLEKNNEKKAEVAANAKGRGSTARNSKASTGTLEVSLNDNGYLKIKAYQSDLESIIVRSAEALALDYFFYDIPEDKTATLIVSEISFDDLLNHIFKGTDYTFKVNDGAYIIGAQSTEGLRVSELIQLENRTIEALISTLPADLLEGVEVREVKELNGFVVSGSKPRITELKTYVREIDKIVPMVQIEVLIVQYQKSYDIQTGLQAILGEEGQDVQTAGTLFPSTNVTLNASSINNLIDSFNGFGIFNLGKVTKNFYANLSTLENNSIINLQSTPKIATLSGNQASVSIGETSWYFELNNELINGRGGDADRFTSSGKWKSTEANLSVNITPNVSKDEQVTLQISVEKSSFLGRVAENAPPGKTTQTFESLVRVRNDEMILLGGLDEVERENSGSGTPFLSRIPVIKWFFSSRRKAKSKSKLHVFIKPTIVY
ncbi:MAG: type II and III secretion system protein [Gilvibacter sp.]